jgi:hypothetical protein
MQIFIIGSILETAQTLDKKRFWKQILEARQIISAILGTSTGWRNHPVTKMYEAHLQWLELYLSVFENYRDGKYKQAKALSDQAEEYKPDFLKEELYIENMKKRLYTKNKDHYSQWASLGESFINLYYIDNAWKTYFQKK